MRSLKFMILLANNKRNNENVDEVSVKSDHRSFFAAVVDIWHIKCSLEARTLNRQSPCVTTYRTPGQNLTGSLHT